MTNKTILLGLLVSLGVATTPIVRAHYEQNYPFSGNYENSKSAKLNCRWWASKDNENRKCRLDYLHDSYITLASNSYVGYERNQVGSTYKPVRSFKWN